MVVTAYDADHLRATSAGKGARCCPSRPGFALFGFDRETLQLEFRDLMGRTLYPARRRRVD